MEGSGIERMPVGLELGLEEDECVYVYWLVPFCYDDVDVDVDV